MYHIRTSCVIASYAYESQIKIKYTLRNIKLIIIRIIFHIKRGQLFNICDNNPLLQPNSLMQHFFPIDHHDPWQRK